MIQFLNFALLFLYYCGKPYVLMKFSKQVVYLLATLNWACSQQSSPEEISNSLQRGIMSAEVVHAAGEYPQLFFNLESKKFEQKENITGLPAPFNFGKLKYIRESNGSNIYVLILGAAVPSGTLLKIRTIGMIRFLNEVEVPLIVGVPEDDAIVAPSIEDFQTLLFENDPTKRMLEQWLTYHNFPFPFSSFFWEDEKATTNWLVKHLIIN